ncbi:MAG: thioredoxin domain-containing protein [Armatimonadota bacterium]
MSVDRSSEIRWRSWGDPAFTEAEESDKLILLDIGASWCHWCHIMDRTTYSNPEVIRIVNERFIPIRVDADKRPDVQDRYLLGGWPTTAFLLPDGRILTGTTFIPPEAMLNKLDEVDALYHDHREIVTLQATSMAAEAEAQRAEVEVPSGEMNGHVMEKISRAVRRDFDPEHGGFGVEPKFPYPEAVRFAFLRHRRCEEGMLRIATTTLDGMMGIYDPVWGGSYRYATAADWSSPHYEKLLYMQAGQMESYLEGYQVTANDKYGEVAAGIKLYVENFLADPEGGFYASQDADVRSHDPDAPLISGEEYFSKGDAERREIGMPYTDKTIFTDWNGMMISAYLQLAAVTGDAHAGERAIRAVERLLERHLCDDRMCHYYDGGPKLPGLLSDQVHFGTALLSAYQTTGESRYLSIAEKLVTFMAAELTDVVDGGFYLKPFDPRAKGEPLERHKPFDMNIIAVRLLIDLHRLTGKQTYREQAERALRAISYPQITDSIIGAGYGVTLDLFSSEPMHVVIVGDRESETTRQMLETALHAYEPGKLVQILDPKTSDLRIGEMQYKAEAEPVAHVCAKKTCRTVRSASELASVM